MEVKAEDLYPREVEFELWGKTYTLKPFSIAHQIWTRSEFATKDEPDGCKVAGNKLMERDGLVVCKLCYRVLNEKDQFPTLESFIEKVFNNEKHHSLSVLIDALDRNFGISQPTEEERDQDKEIAELGESQAATIE